MAVMAKMKMKLPNVSELPIDICRKGLAKMMSFFEPPAGCILEKVDAGDVKAVVGECG